MGSSNAVQMAVAGLTRISSRARQDPKRHWRAYLERKGLKTTQQREAIVDAFLRSSGHVALEDLLSSAPTETSLASAWPPSTGR